MAGAKIRAVKNALPRLAGLAVAWGGTALLLTPAAQRLGGAFGLIGMWLWLAIVGAIVVFWEKQPLASIGLRRLSWRSITWGLLLAAFTIFITIPALTWLLRLAGIPAFEAGMAKALAQPRWLRAFGVLTAAVVEDSLFVGYAFTRLEALTRSRVIAGIIATVAFAFLHLPNWGIGPVLAYLVAIGIAVAFFAWRRDLLANIVAHAVVDGMGLLVW